MAVPGAFGFVTALFVVCFLDASGVGSLGVVMSALLVAVALVLALFPLVGGFAEAFRSWQRT
jgi:hypothetical protein